MIRSFSILPLVFFLTCAFTFTPFTVSIDFQNVTCFGGQDGSITITVDGGTSPFAYNWEKVNDPAFIRPSDASVIQNLGIGTYNLTVSDDDGDQVVRTIVIGSPDPFSVSNSVTPVKCEGDATGSIDLVVNGGTEPYSFAWGDGEDTEDRINVPANIYSVLISDDNGCTLNIPEIEVLEGAPCSAVKVYNGFSPNGDGINDYFAVARLSAVQNATLKVFNRWGNLVYQKENYETCDIDNPDPINCWDGTNQSGVGVPDGTYHYILIATLLEDNSEQKFTGYVQIHR